MRNSRSSSFSYPNNASPQLLSPSNATTAASIMVGGVVGKLDYSEMSDSISVVSSILTDEYRPFKPTNSKQPYSTNNNILNSNNNNNSNNNRISLLNSSSSLNENDRKEIENLRAAIKEIKAKKMVLDYETSQRENNIQNHKEKNVELNVEADESFALWNLARQETLDFISEDITSSYDFGDLSLSDESGNERDLLWRKLKHYRTIYCKIMQYIEVRESEIRQLESEEQNDFDEIVKLNKSIEADIEHLVGKRAEMESRSEHIFKTIVEKKKDNDLKRQNIEMLKERVSQAETKTQQEIQLLAKKLFK